MTKTFENLTPEEMEELKRLGMSVMPKNSHIEQRYLHLLAKARYFAEGDYDFEDLGGGEL